MNHVDFELTGADSAEVAGLLKIPKLEDGVWGWRGILEQGAQLRELRVRQLRAELGYDVVVAVRPASGSSPV